MNRSRASSRAQALIKRKNLHRNSSHGLENSACTLISFINIHEEQAEHSGPNITENCIIRKLSSKTLANWLLFLSYNENDILGGYFVLCVALRALVRVVIPIPFSDLKCSKFTTELVFWKQKKLYLTSHRRFSRS